MLELGEIQSNVISGFPHACRLFLFFRIEEVQRFRSGLRGLRNCITSSLDALDARAGRQSCTGLNLALSYSGLLKLRTDATRFTDEAFTQGLARRSVLLGDPKAKQAPGNPGNWLFGGSNNPVDGVVIVAAATAAIADEARDEIAGRLCRGAKTGASAARIVFCQLGARLPGWPSEREHFGFRDEVSQPRLRGRRSMAADTYHEPGSRDNCELVWPGEFVFGYPSQGRDSALAGGNGRLSNEAPAWARNGSLLVIRRLWQDVGAFHAFALRTSESLAISPELVAARMVGRWPSGASLIRSPVNDGGEHLASDFTFQTDVDVAEAALPSDPDGLLCPISAHIRKMNPRGVYSSVGNTFPNPGDTQRHRIMRRGIPFGAPSPSTPSHPIRDTVDRGLMFVCYQTSIEEQFEFIQRRWANEANFPEALSGHDPIIGQRRDGLNRRRFFRVDAASGSPLETFEEWVIPTGGEYFFSPSLSALELLGHA